MRVLVTGGTGVIGRGLIPALQRAGHDVRLLTRHAERDARDWEDVEPWSASVTDPESLAGALDGCDALIHITGIVHEDPPEATFDLVNVEGTRNVLAEAERAGRPRVLYVSSLGADRGASDYHRSKRDAERLVVAYPGRWTILRPGNVYGPGDEVVSLLLRMVRTLPVVPVVGRDKRFQPIWFEDLGEALARVLDRHDLDGRTLEMAGPDVLTVAELVDRLEGLTDRSPMDLPVALGVARAGAKLVEKVPLAGRLAHVSGLELPLDSAKLEMLEEENLIGEGGDNALPDLLGRPGTPISEGLYRLAENAMPEQLPEEGVGALERKRFWAVAHGSRLTAPELMRVFRSEARQILPIEFVDEPGRGNGVPPASPGPIERGETLTMKLPARGEIQVRAEEADDHHVTLATLEGHPLAGVVRFTAEGAGDGGRGDVRFEVEVFARSANFIDLVAMKAGGKAMQSSVWARTVERVVERSGGHMDGGVRHEVESLDEERAEDVEGWIRALVQHRRREDGPEGI